MMQIKYLTELEKNPVRDGFEIEGIPQSEITALEIKYNSGNDFPIALKELLFLAGKYCTVLDYGPEETMEAFQDVVREWLVDENHTINRPFFAIDSTRYCDYFLFVYLDDGDNPQVWQACIYPDIDFNFLTDSNATLKEFIERDINLTKQGLNPF